ncbi:MAG: hypothetical protein IIC73_02525 [Armatimonadetes bacterium]|nr:hypothetical protein [Armatimonadota bacterium]
MRVRALVVLPMLLALFVGQAWMQQKLIYPFWKENYAPRRDSDYSSLSPDQMLLALAGFREMIAGLLWVRADTFFDEGNYDAILPMIRIVTILDPKQIDVYSTGMWHIAYNFTDEAQRSDRRYIAPALALGREGSEHNSYTYELYFETGWLWYHKIDDEYAQAVKWFEEAKEFDHDKLLAQYKGMGMSDAEAAYRAAINSIPPARRNLLAQAYLRNGQVDSARDLFWELFQDAARRAETDDRFQARVNMDTIEGNLDNHLVRMSQRGEFARRRGETDLSAYDTEPPFDIGFSASVTVIQPKILLVQGTWGVLPVGTRVRFILRDDDFDGAVPGGMDWERTGNVSFSTPVGETFLMDLLFVKNQRFTRKIDMSRDVTMYPMTKDNYVMEFYYNPRSAPAHIQDKFGFNGEGMTDANFLNTEIREGQRVIFARLEITKDMLYRTGEYRLGRKTPVVNTANYLSVGTMTESGAIIRVPGLRGR